MTAPSRPRATSLTLSVLSGTSLSASELRRASGQRVLTQLLERARDLGQTPADISRGRAGSSPASLAVQGGAEPLVTSAEGSQRSQSLEPTASRPHTYTVQQGRTRLLRSPSQASCPSTEDSQLNAMSETADNAPDRD